MKQFTLLFVEDDDTKEVKTKVFLDFGNLLEYKHNNKLIEKSKLQIVDSDGYIWYCESDLCNEREI